MPIKELDERRQMPRLGKIRLGIKVEKEGGRSYPRATDYFVVPDEIKRYVGDEPKSLNIMFPSDDKNEFAPQWLKCYSFTQGLTCRGDGMMCRRKVDTETSARAGHTTKKWTWEDGLVCDPPTCPDYSGDKPQCRPVMNLLFLLPDAPGIGVWQCLSSDSQILTDRGWLGQNQVLPGDKAITFNINTGRYEEQAIQTVLQWPWGRYDMIRFQQRSLDCIITPKHRVIYRPEHNSHWRIDLAEDVPARSTWPVAGQVMKPELTLPLPGRTHCLDCGALLKTQTIRRMGRAKRNTTKQYPYWSSERRVVRCQACSYLVRALTRKRIEPLSDDVLRLLGWLITEGSNASSGLDISQSVVHQEQIDHIQTVLTRLFGHIKKRIIPRRTHQFPNATMGQSSDLIIFRLNAQQRRYICSILGSDIHSIPRLLLNQLSPRQLKILYSTLLEGDGHKNHKSRRVYFFPGKNKGLADDFQELCTRLGFRSSVGTKQDGQYVVSVGEHRSYRQFRNKGHKVSVETAPWCITVPNGTFICRRNGSVFTTGNCDTSSFYSITNINNAVDLIKRLCGRIRMIPLSLTLEPQEVEPLGMRKKTVHILNIRSDIMLKDIRRLGRGEEQVQIAAPEEDEVPDDIHPGAAGTELTVAGTDPGRTGQNRAEPGASMPAADTPAPVAGHPANPAGPGSFKPFLEVVEDDVPDWSALYRICFHYWKMQPDKVAQELGFRNTAGLMYSGLTPWQGWLSIKEPRTEDR